MDIKRLRHRDELHDIVNIQKQVWINEIIPLHKLLSDLHNGGILLGAYDGDNMLGFQYSCPAFVNRRVYLWSNMTAVLPALKSRGMGYALKLRQRVEAANDGYSLIAWTFDPLESLNAHLNIGKLGAICSSYLEDYYGELDDKLNSGLPTDRLLVEWPTLTIDKYSEQLTTLRVQLPGNVQQLKQHDKSAALHWRLKVRRELRAAFAAGDAICGFCNHGAHAQYHEYLLRPRIQLNVEDAPWSK